jgi:dolichol-phosphate mannosyltransferase
MYYDNNWAVVVPMANEEGDFAPFIAELTEVLNRLNSGSVYFVVDSVSKDKTLEMCKTLSKKDNRFITVYAPENRNVVDAYIRGYKEAYQNGHEIIIEMDAGMSHDPKALPLFLRVLNEGNDCAFGSRFINGGSMVESPKSRRFLSRTGTLLSNVLLGSSLYDMTSGFQGFRRPIVKKIIDSPLLSKAHFYQTELRYLLRNTKYAEIPIHYKAPSPSVSKKAIYNSLFVLMIYFFKRLSFNAPSL